MTYSFLRRNWMLVLVLLSTLLAFATDHPTTRPTAPAPQPFAGLAPAVRPLPPKPRHIAYTP